MVKPISVIIPNRNGGAFIGKCLEAVFSTRYGRYEVIVVDDCSEDDSVEIIGKFPCRLIRLEKHSGASKARNTGAFHSTGQILFFTDADCLVRGHPFRCRSYHCRVRSRCRYRRNVHCGAL